MRRNVLCLALLSLPMASSIAYPHGGKIHGGSQEEKRESKDTVNGDGFELVEEGPSQHRLRAVNQEYVRTIKPIFDKKCFDCHGESTRYPWYYQLPGARQLIDFDIREAKKHMDLSNDFPFKGHGSPEDDLEAVANVLKSNEMPPMRYWIMHWGSRLIPEEKQVILDWVKRSQEALGYSANHSSYFSCPRASWRVCRAAQARVPGFVRGGIVDDHHPVRRTPKGGLLKCRQRESPIRS